MNIRRHSWLIALTAIQVALFGVELVTHYDTTQRQLALALTNVFAVTAVWWFNGWLEKRGSHLSWLTVVLVFGAVWLDALGNFQHLYGHFWWWDRITHTLGGMAVSAGFIDFYQAWRRTGKLQVTWGQATWFGFLVGQFLGAVYEMSEWFGDMWFHTERVRGPYDTPHDLFFNAVGGALVVILLTLFNKTREQPKP